MRNRRLRQLAWLIILLLVSCGAPSATAPTPVASPVVVTLPTALATPLPAATLAVPSTPLPAELTPLLTDYRGRTEAALRATPPILLLDPALDGPVSADAVLAQTIAVQSKEVQQYIYESNTRTPHRVQVFGVYPLRDSDQTATTTKACQPANACQRVELYNFALNATIRAIVNPAAGTLVTVDGLPHTQPDIPPSLTKVAIEIATRSPEVAKAMGYDPRDLKPVMASTKTALNTTRCERSEHLCVAPTFTMWGQALWTIVDLTDGGLVGTRWTQVGETGNPATERSMQDAVITSGYCDHTTHLEQHGWSLDYMLTASDGLRISDVRYQGKPVFDSVKLVDWHVSYSRKDGFGYSDAVGCPVFSMAAVIATQPPQVQELREHDQVVGFTLTQPFWSELWPRPCAYNYQQAYQFYTDGRFRPAVASFGRGCGNDGTYRPVTRIALAGDGRVQEWKAATWQDWTTEGWRLDDGAAPAADGSSFHVQNAAGGGVAVHWGRGQFGDGGRGDNAYVYITKHHGDRDEGDSDLPTIGPCCNTNADQGPERFIDNPPESTANTGLVLWYVAQLKNDSTPGKQYCWAESNLGADGVYHATTYPCWSGPLFSPLRGGS